MEQKTKVHAEDGKQELLITREFDLPLELLFKAYTVPEFLEQWMGTEVVKLENKPHGSWQIQTKDGRGNVVFRANGVIHEFVPEQKITRTFEMENTPFGVQLEFLEFEALTDDTSKLNIHTLCRSVALRDQMIHIGVGMAKGLEMAHNRLQEVIGKLK
ncbi:SRPBCC domain-containing protein [Chitinophaga sp. 22321]|uniref:SRPBCC domain-containing protein n=1 Tax=Chitinophaga hostae TaxID=2831022 RepID=A0ABS5J2N1_9BACT|nr:SRPBCC domain-containing protein [Chitinophaga hostae]MBS0029301.1 SRPBCC domain-containing protein [Chitinophaga hostae]